MKNIIGTVQTIGSVYLLYFLTAILQLNLIGHIQAYSKREGLLFQDASIVECQNLFYQVIMKGYWFHFNCSNTYSHFLSLFCARIQLSDWSVDRKCPLFLCYR